ncbi:uncharacterized protein N7503_002649 [Penicillium pulvis]|uniref:uncharacterized protein n=1 Tax=Penicillium pulvis TaxID=1562058 RepID=UPI0025493B0B|nr:uncharacterized protein N7503_002649 [Penicillium pulvis]KAJ5810431.1 hypothetical protein N7503_002649 [Penicillium pulvis]
MSCVNFGDKNSGYQVGINEGVINFSAEQLEPRPEPLSTVPFPHDPDFVSRIAILDQIREKASVPGSRIALFGLGGVGKTQLAIEYAHQLRQQSAETWVFWIHASNTARCEESLRGLADRVKIPGRQVHNVNIFQLVGNWLQDENIGRWVLVLDNIDDDELFRRPMATSTGDQINMQSNASAQPPMRYLLGSTTGTIIITSRDRNVALEVANHANVIEVQPMNDAEALVLLQKKLNTPEHENLTQLAQELEYMPLAIVQAASYITHRSPLCSVSQYLQKIRKSDREAVRVLNEEAGLVYRDWEAKNSILLTWQISFDFIRRKRPSATDLLSLMSFFDRQGITKDILQVQQNQERGEEDSSNTSDTDSESRNELDADFEDDIMTLRDFALIAVGRDGMSFTMHRLVQLTIRTWLKTHNQLEHWKGQFIEKLYSEFPTTGQHENWEKCRSLFPHVKGAVSQRPESQHYVQQWTELLYRGAWYAQELGYITESREMASRSRKFRLEILGKESEETIASTAMLAGAYCFEGRWEEAEHLQVQVMEISKTKLSADHPDTLTSMANLAVTYWNQGRWDEAEHLQVQVMEMSKTKLGADHPNTLKSMANLAVTYWNQGRWEEAEHLQVQVIEMSKTKLGADHPNTLKSMANLAVTYSHKGQWEEAEQLDVQVMEARKAKLSADHPDTLTSMANLASRYWNQGRWGEAEQLDIQVMEISKTKLGADHPNTLTSMANLAVTYRNQGRWDEAEHLQVQVMEISKTKLGADHPNTLTSMANLAVTYRNQGRWDEAEHLQVQVMEMSKTKLGADHPNTLKSMANLAVTYSHKGRWEEAEQLNVQVIEARKAKLGADHPDTLTSMANLASRYWNQGRWGEAEHLEVQVMEARKAKLGADHPNTLTSMANLAFTLKSTGRCSEAIDLLKTCLTKQQRILGSAHPNTVFNSDTLLAWETGDLAIVS